MSKGVILCVDDEEIVLKSIESQLTKEFGLDFDIELAESGGEALEVLDELNGDGIDIFVIITDWLMPDMKGDELLIEAHKKFPKIVKVMLTGQADGKAIKKAKENANLHMLIEKPWKAEDLIKSIRTGLARL